MKKQPDEEILDNLHCRQPQHSEHLKPLLSLYIQDIVQKGESRLQQTFLCKFAVQHLEQKNSQEAFLAKDNLKSPPPALLQAEGNSKGTGTRNSGDCVPRTTKGQCSLGDKYGMKHDPTKKREPRGKR